MVELSSSVFDGSSNKSWRPRRYQRINSYRKSVKTVTFGGKKKRFWKIKAIPRLRLKKFSPIRLYLKFKNAYINMMLRLGGTENVFGSKRIPKRGQVSSAYSMEQFQNRLIYEISKNLFTARELAAL
uniref:uncharacterized protein LOC122610161 n=1 Tax=Erigeron canadensis TaxID=72917 RepID=UPI001CB95E3E|nr:uncharacterized protein LOC122610161 [Erigeron canadensis]